ncbi:MAG: hypothetical protein EON61_13565 [Alphaproteobacteria bacterium]|nr:MAG: hypothetical protein EON61_13565 [Alphaproteobacteria bacterium]
MPFGHASSHTGGMGQGKHATASQERRVKRLGYRYGVLLMKCAKPFGKVAEHGGYMLRMEDSRTIVLGNNGYEYSATLDEIEAFLEAQPKIRDDEGED